MSTPAQEPRLTKKERIERLPLKVQKALYDITDIANWLDDENQPESATLIESRDALISVLEANSTDALADLKAKVEDRRQHWRRIEANHDEDSDAYHEALVHEMEAQDILTIIDAALKPSADAETSRAAPKEETAI